MRWLHAVVALGSLVSARGDEASLQGSLDEAATDVESLHPALDAGAGVGLDAGGMASDGEDEQDASTPRSTADRAVPQVARELEVEWTECSHYTGVGVGARDGARPTRACGDGRRLRGAWDAGSNRGSKYIALEKAADNGCTVPETIETWEPDDPTRHLCVDLENCDAGYPVRVCTFDGGHWQFPYDEGDGEDLSRSWVPVESWNFFTQF